jgi:hypothetical protein
VWLFWLLGAATIAVIDIAITSEETRSTVSLKMQTLSCESIGAVTDSEKRRLRLRSREFLQADTETDAETRVEAEADCVAVAVVVDGLQPLSLNAVADTVVVETALFQLLLNMNMLLLFCCRTRLVVAAQAAAGAENENLEAAMLSSLKSDDVGLAEGAASRTGGDVTAGVAAEVEVAEVWMGCMQLGPHWCCCC